MIEMLRLTENADRTRYKPSSGNEIPSNAITYDCRYRKYKKMQNIKPVAGADRTISPADQIGAAYAYARGHTGEGIIISNMGGRVSLNNDDLDGTAQSDFWLQSQYSPPLMVVRACLLADVRVLGIRAVAHCSLLNKGSM